MRTAFKLTGLVFVFGILGYLFSNDLRWLYAAFTIAAIPVLAQLIWRERISFKDLLRPRKH